MNFAKFKNAVAAQFAKMCASDIFVVDVNRDELWECYLSSFPEGTNPIYRERREYDCNCCKNFIRDVGDCVAAIDGKLVSIWDVTIEDEPEFQIVADALAKFVHSRAVKNVFLSKERTAGKDKTFEDMVTGVKTWEHFFVNIPPKFVNVDPAAELGRMDSLFKVLKRGVDTIAESALQSVLDLIDENQLYRGESYKSIVLEFKAARDVYYVLKALNDQQTADTHLWIQLKHWGSAMAAIASIRNSAIGTLLVAISEGADLEDAVKAFEKMVAPENYKRTSSIVTQKMVDAMKAEIEAQGYLSALRRRNATINDVNVNNVIFIDRSPTAATADIFDTLASGEKIKGGYPDVTFEQFVDHILPKTEAIELLLTSRHKSNLVSLITAEDPTASCMFKWGNNFSWAYNGDFTDAIKERVKAAGGNVTGDVCCRLAWFNYDDLDLHMEEPDGNHIYFRTRVCTSPSGGKLDVDMNAGHGETRTPVENIFYGDHRKMKDGKYRLFVHMWQRRERTQSGFVVDVEIMGVRYSFSSDVSKDGNTDVACITVKNGQLSITSSLPYTTDGISEDVWGIQTGKFIPVSSIMLSPNFWDGQVGNRHFFFMLSGCKNPGQSRGFFNEYLKSELDPHRKAFDVLGSKMRVPASDQQLSGVGFASTVRNKILCRVRGGINRTFNLSF